MAHQALQEEAADQRLRAQYVLPPSTVGALLYSHIDVLCLFVELFLNDEDVRKVHEFEEDCVEGYFNNLEMKFESSTDEQIRATNQR